MSYYRVGDYYLAGDPGLFSAIGAGIRGAVRAGVGFLSGGPVGAIAAVMPSVSGGRSTGSGLMVPRIASPGPTVGSILPATLPMLIPPQGIPIGPQAGAAGVQPSGYHLNKTAYFLKSGAYVAPGTKWVRNRRRNFANGRALNRAITRTAGFSRLVKRSRKNLRALAKI